MNYDLNKNLETFSLALTGDSFSTMPEVQTRIRLFIKPKTGVKEQIEIIKWAAQNNYNTVVFSLGEKLSANSKCIKMAKHYGLFIEAGGRDLSLLIPRKLFMFHSGLFRMEQGKRKKKYHFCPTNPKVTSVISKCAGKLFTRFMQLMSVPRIFHLLPDEGEENSWCACPACRAFSPFEQNIIAVNCAADVLAKLDPEALLSFLNTGTTPEAEGISPRGNMFQLNVKS
jgi:hypothetical protein